MYLNMNVCIYKWSRFGPIDVLQSVGGSSAMAPKMRRAESAQATGVPPIPETWSGGGGVEQASCGGGVEQAARKWASNRAPALASKRAASPAAAALVQPKKPRLVGSTAANESALQEPVFSRFEADRRSQPGKDSAQDQPDGAPQKKVPR